MLACCDCGGGTSPNELSVDGDSGSGSEAESSRQSPSQPEPTIEVTGGSPPSAFPPPTMGAEGFPSSPVPVVEAAPSMPPPPPPTLAPVAEAPEAPTPSEKTGSSPKPGPAPTPSMKSALGERTLNTEEGFFLCFSPTASGTLQGRYASKVPKNALLHGRPREPLTEGQLKAQPFTYFQGVRSDWARQAKATLMYLKTVCNANMELEILPSFFTELPRKSMFVVHFNTEAMQTLRGEGAFDFNDKGVDGICVLPEGSEAFRGITRMGVVAFLSKGATTGQAMRMQ